MLMIDKSRSIPGDSQQVAVPFVYRLTPQLDMLMGMISAS